MRKFLAFLIALAFYSCKAQSSLNSTAEFTSDLENFYSINKLKQALEGVEIVALGENTHGLGEVFATKSALVQFLHQELGFNLVLFESGYGDAALAWERLDSLTAKEYTQVFSSNFYYHSDEILKLITYVKSQNGNLVIQGFDCQPQQNYLIKRMQEIALPIDSNLANSVLHEMQSFNKLYQYENVGDTVLFYQQRDSFIVFLNRYNTFLDESQNVLLNTGTTKNEISTLKKSNEIFLRTYSTIQFGEMMGWPAYANLRDKSLFETVSWFKESNPEAKIIIWAQNSHIENSSKPNYNVEWMGHGLKRVYGNKYYSIGTIVYSGKNMNYNGSFDFEHNDDKYLAYHLNQYQKEKYVLDLRNYDRNDFTTQLLLGMENNGSMAEFIAKDRFDALLFIKYSDIPHLIKPQ